VIVNCVNFTVVYDNSVTSALGRVPNVNDNTGTGTGYGENAGHVNAAMLGLSTGNRVLAHAVFTVRVDRKTVRPRSN
jgi:hypothetical protein